MGREEADGGGDRATLYSGGRIYTQDGARPWAEAMLVAGGRVLWTGRDDEVGTGLAATRIDLAGRVVLPGLVDAHTHFLSHSLLAARVDLRWARDEADAVAQVAAYAAAHPRHAWIQGHGWNESVWPGRRLPSRASLDAAVPDRPVVLSRADGHMVWVNSRALEAAGIGEGTPEPPDGKIDRDGDGRPVGILRENAARPVYDRVPPPALPERLEALRRGQDEALRLGLVGVHTMEGRETLEALQVLRDGGDLSLRVLVLPPVEDLAHLAAAGVRAGFGDEWLRLGQLKVFADGSLGSRTAWMLEPFEGEPGNRGIAIRPPDELAAVIREAHLAGWPCAVHAIGDAAAREVLEALALAPGAGSPLPDRMEHAQIVQPRDMRRLAALGVVASMQPVHVSTDWRIADRNWGGRARWSYAWRSMMEAGATLAFGSDAPVEPLDPWAGLMVALTRRDLGGEPQEGWYPEERLGLAEAIAGFTTGCAAAAGEPGGGRLAPGSRADFIVLQDPFALAPEEVGRLRPLTTVVGGRAVWSA